MCHAVGELITKACSRLRSEAAALLGTDGLTAEQAALALGPLCDMAIVTDGANGSCISALGTLHVHTALRSTLGRHPIVLARGGPTHLRAVTGRCA